MKRQRKKYLRPLHPWEKDRIQSENKLLSQFGLHRKEEVWRTETLLRGFRRQARKLLAASGPQAELETKQLLARLGRLGLVGEAATLDEVLGLSIEKLLERRLQTFVHKKGLAQTPLQARQLVLHGHIAIADKKVNVPSYLVPVREETLIKYAKGTSFPGIKPPEAQAAPVPEPSAETDAAPVEANAAAEPAPEKAEAPEEQPKEGENAG